MAWKKDKKNKNGAPPRFEHIFYSKEDNTSTTTKPLAFLWQYSLLQHHFVASTPVATNISGTITTNTVAP